MAPIILLIIVILVIFAFVSMSNCSKYPGIMSVDYANYAWNDGTMPLYDSSSPVYINGRDDIYPLSQEPGMYPL